MTSKELLEQDYIKICPECGDLASKDSDICENCNHDLSQEPLYDTNDFSEIKRIAQDYKNRVVEDDVAEDTATNEVTEAEIESTDNAENIATTQNNSNESSGIGCIILSIISLILGSLISLGIVTEGFSWFKHFHWGSFFILTILFTFLALLITGGFYSVVTSSDTSISNEAEEKTHDNNPNTPISCPKCGCTQLSANKKGFSYWTGAIGSQKVYITCLRCGHRWKAGDRR